jgi:transposase InsO family protein
MPNQTSLAKKKLLLKIIFEHPSWGPSRLSFELRQHSISLTPWTVWYTLRRFGLQTRWKRLLYLEALRHTNQPLTERTLRTTQRRLQKQYQGFWPGHLVSLDTFYVGCLKGVGRIYQVTGIDIASRFGLARLYTHNDQRATMHFVENTLIPILYHNGVSIERMLTDNGSEYTGSLFNRCLSDYEISHVYIPKGRPACNGYVERFQRTLYEEFYQKVFRCTVYADLPQLQKDLDDYLIYYNFQRPHFGLDPNGALPIDVLKTKKTVLQQRFSDLVST